LAYLCTTVVVGCTLESDLFLTGNKSLADKLDGDRSLIEEDEALCQYK